MSAGFWRGVALGTLVSVVFVVGVLWMPTGSWAPQPLIRMGVVDWERVLLEYNDFQRAMEQLEEREEDLLRQFHRPSRPGRDEDSISGDDLGNVRDDLRRQLIERRREIIRSHHQRVLNAIEQEAVRQGYSLILSKNEVLYASEDYTDLTRDVINRLN